MYTWNYISVCHKFNTIYCSNCSKQYWLNHNKNKSSPGTWTRCLLCSHGLVTWAWCSLGLYRTGLIGTLLLTLAWYSVNYHSACYACIVCLFVRNKEATDKYTDKHTKICRINNSTYMYFHCIICTISRKYIPIININIPYHLSLFSWYLTELLF